MVLTHLYTHSAMDKTSKDKYSLWGQDGSVFSLKIKHKDTEDQISGDTHT